MEKKCTNEFGNLKITLECFVFKLTNDFKFTLLFTIFSVLIIYTVLINITVLISIINDRLKNRLDICFGIKFISF
jgi:hypothetical protein